MSQLKAEINVNLRYYKISSVNQRSRQGKTKASSIYSWLHQGDIKYFYELKKNIKKNACFAILLVFSEAEALKSGSCRERNWQFNF